jgi:hypothetical protein
MTDPRSRGPGALIEEIGPLRDEASRELRRRIRRSLLRNA